MMLSSITFIASLLTVALANPQGANVISTKYPNDRTLSVNGTWFIVPIPRTAALALASPYTLVDPTLDLEFFPPGFPADKWPAIVSSTYQTTINQGVTSIPNLMGASILIPYVDRLGDKKTPFTVQVRQFLGPVQNQLLANILPTILNSLVGTPVYFGTFAPNTAHATTLAGNSFSFSVQASVVANIIPLLPTAYQQAISSTFTTLAAPVYPSLTFTRLLNNSTVILTNGLCSRQYYYFDQPFALQTFRTGSVTLSSGPVPASIAGVYTNVRGFSGNAELVQFNGEDCATAAANNHPFLHPARKVKRDEDSEE